MSDQRITLGEYLRRRLRDKRMTVRKFAESSRLSYYYLSKIVNDQEVPALDSLVRIAAALDAPLDELLQLSKGEAAQILDNLLEQHGRAYSLRAARYTGVNVTDEERLVAEFRNWPPSLRAALAKLAKTAESDVQGLAQALEALLALPPDERNRWIRATTAYVQKEGSES